MFQHGTKPKKLSKGRSATVRQPRLTTTMQIASYSHPLPLTTPEPRASLDRYALVARTTAV